MVLLVQVLLEELCLNENEVGRQGCLRSDGAREVVPLLGNEGRK